MTWIPCPWRHRVRAMGVCAMMGAAGCAQRSAPNPFDTDRPDELRVTVDNQNFNDLRIYAITTGGPRSLGRVGGQSRVEFRLEWRQLDDIRFRLEFLAGDQFTTTRLNVSPGDIVEVSVPQNPNNTIVRRR